MLYTVRVSRIAMPRCRLPVLLAGPAVVPTTTQDMEVLTYSMFASAAEVAAADLLASVADSIANIADAPAPGGGCQRATRVAIAFYNGLLIAAPETAPAFAARIGIQVPETQWHSPCQCPFS